MENVYQKIRKRYCFKRNYFTKGTVLTPDYIKSLPKNQQEAAHDLNRRTDSLF
jgi:hypothetical protein